jgi:hypothetical protein
MNPQQSKASTSSSRSTAALPIRRATSAPRLSKNLRPLWTTGGSALVRSPISTPDSSSGDEAVWIKPKGRAQFECNICFDAARDPVVTQCGHLYCWPCLHQVTPSSSIQFAYIQWLSSPSIAPDPTCPTCKSGCEIPSLIPIYGRGPSSPPRSSASSSKSPSSSKKIPRALRFADVFLLPYLKSPSANNVSLPPRPQAKQLPPRSILQNSPFYMLLQSAQQHYPFLPEGTVLAVPQGATTRFGRPHLFMLVFAIWAALFKMMADSGRSWRTFSAFDTMGSTRSIVIVPNGAEGDTVGRIGLILGMCLGFALLWYRSRQHAHGVVS